MISGQAASTVERARLVQDLKSGKCPVRVDFTRFPDVSCCSFAANTDLVRSQTSLESNNRNLESAVSSRTIELRDQNKRLEAEIAEKERAQAEMRVAKEVAESATAMKSQFLGQSFSLSLSLIGEALAHRSSSISQYEVSTASFAPRSMCLLRRLPHPVTVCLPAHILHGSIADCKYRNPDALQCRCRSHRTPP